MKPNKPIRIGLEQLMDPDDEMREFLMRDSAWIKSASTFDERAMKRAQRFIRKHGPNAQVPRHIMEKLALAAKG